VPHCGTAIPRSTGASRCGARFPLGLSAPRASLVLDPPSGAFLCGMGLAHSGTLMGLPLCLSGGRISAWAGKSVEEGEKFRVLGGVAPG